MVATATTERITEVEKAALDYRPGYRYGLLTDDKGTTLSLHDDETPGLVWLSGFTPKGSPRAARLDLEQALALREMLSSWIADQAATTPPPPTGA